MKLKAMPMEEKGQGSSEPGTNCAEIETTADSLDGSIIFHAINDVSGFVLYMHQQIPSVLQDMSFEFETLCAKYNELETEIAQIQGNASLRRKHASEMREVKHGIRRFQKLMRSISEFQTALKLMISEVPNIEGAILVLGASPIRPQHVYEFSFSNGKSASLGAPDFAKSRAAEALSKKAIRALISKGAGSGTYPGISKLFLLVKAPSSLNLPLHFLPKRDFRYSKKIVPFRVRFKCRTQVSKEMNAIDLEPHTCGLTESTPTELIWFQCRHVIKGLAFNTQTEE
ncbi:nonstructural protein [Parasponia andersonii]|uniref:Nonstructural protein n=1 Tax=Parasponia andersonii TaxID=3476 RepID=A0A2P5C2Q0_PARAD|nr:nonstructural protein [Parasponia andersonii]